MITTTKNEYYNEWAVENYKTFERQKLERIENLCEDILFLLKIQETDNCEQE